MRVALAAAVAALLMAGSAVAQTEGAATSVPVPVSTCGELPVQPTVPDGATADREGMDAANLTYTAWSTAYHANLQCRRVEADTARTVWQARVAEYNGGATALNAANTAWEAEVAEFNARGPAPANSGRRTTRQ